MKKKKKKKFCDRSKICQWQTARPLSLTEVFVSFVRISIILANNIVRAGPFFACMRFSPCPGGGGGTPYNGLYGEAPLERGTFFRLQV